MTYPRHSKFAPFPVTETLICQMEAKRKDYGWKPLILSMPHLFMKPSELCASRFAIASVGIHGLLCILYCILAQSLRMLELCSQPEVLLCKLRGPRLRILQLFTGSQCSLKLFRRCLKLRAQIILLFRSH